MYDDVAGSFSRCLRFIAVVTALIVLHTVPMTAAQKKIMFMGNTGYFGPELEDAFAQFTKRTGIAIEQIPVASWPDMNQKFITMSAAGVAPDVVYGDDLRIFAFCRAEAPLHPIDDPIARDRVNLRALSGAGSRIDEGARTLLLAAYRGQHLRYFLQCEQFGKKRYITFLPTDWFTDEFTWEDFVRTPKS